MYAKISLKMNGNTNEIRTKKYQQRRIKTENETKPNEMNV